MNTEKDGASSTNKKLDSIDEPFYFSKSEDIRQVNAKCGFTVGRSAGCKPAIQQIENLRYEPSFGLRNYPLHSL